MPNFPKNEYFLPPDTHTYVCVSGGKKYSFFGKFGVLCFLETPVLRFAFNNTQPFLDPRSLSWHLNNEYNVSDSNKLEDCWLQYCVQIIINKPPLEN